MENKISKSGKRIEWVDIAKYICIMFVMLSHLESGSKQLDLFYSPFFLTVFFFLSGYVYKKTNTFKELLIKKIKTLLVPWFIFSNFNIILSMFISFKKDRNLVSEVLWNLLQIREQGDGLWFIAALFVAFIPFYFFIKWDNPKKSCLVALLLSVLSTLYTCIFPKDILPWGSSALPWHTEYIFKAMLWMVLGYYFRLYAESILDKYNTIVNRIVLFIIYLISVYIPSGIIGGVLCDTDFLHTEHFRNFKCYIN